LIRVPTSTSDLTSYYDNLDLWTRWNRGFRRFSGHETRTIHRWLVDPESGEFSPNAIHKLMAPWLAPLAPLRALDAGCGYGGTALALRQQLGGRWHGVTISPRQFQTACALARERGEDRDVTFALASYDDPLPDRYTAIYGIESLIHSVDPALTVANLAGTLEPGGVFVIVDDMPVDDVPGRFAADLASFKDMWRAPVMPSARQWSGLLLASGCDVVECRDLSPMMRPRSEPEISQAIGEVMSRRRWRDLVGWRRVGEAEIGGLLLERLGREGAVAYTMIVARKRSAH
jgi:SAM-dependent methyltransferase